MMSSPQARPRVTISPEPPKRPQDEAPAPPPSASRHPRPQVLMGEVMAPRGTQPGPGREALRAFMTAHRLTPTLWAAAAGIAPGELLAFLTGRARAIAPASLEKLAAAAGVSTEALFAEKKNDGL